MSTPDPQPQLSPERWQRLEAAFVAIAELSEAGREEAVARETAGDPELGRLLGRMLRAASAAPGRIAGAIERTAEALAPAPADWVGRRFGPYAVLREIGRGGMGVVFEAVRADDEYRKRVALKIAPGWRGDPAAHERFRTERQILAELEHEHIARFLDGGTEDGIPYFAMELVDGVPITTYCDRAGLGLTARLALFRQVCLAVEFAHERLVVHRDLKPANILVTAQGLPKLVDFGIAKVLGTAGGSGATQTVQAAWTPDYVSPEQLRGGVITARTDVYSLGLLLYELVSGARARTVDTSSLVAMDRSVSETEPPAPSQRLAARGERARARQVAGDLDTIVLTAVRAVPEERYRSVAALSDDVGRFLDGHPILARKAGVVHRARKFVNRNAAGVAAGLVMLAIAAAGLTTTYREGRRADRRFQQVRSLANAFVFDVHDRIETLPGATEARHTIVKTALTYLESLGDEVGDDVELARELAAAYEKIGSVQGLPTGSNLGDTAGAVASYQRGLALLEPLVEHDAAATVRAVSILDRLGIVQRARGDLESAMASFDRGLDLGRRLLRERPDDPGILEALGGVLTDRGRSAFGRGDFAAAEQDAVEAMEIAQRLVALAPDDPTRRSSLASAHLALGTAQVGASKIVAAAEHYRQAVAIREALVGDHPTNTEYRRQLMVSYGNLAEVLAYRPGDSLGEWTGAADALSKAALLAEQARRDDPKDRRALYDLANIRIRLGSVYQDAEPPRSAEALEEFRRTSEYVDTLLAQDPGVATYQYLHVALIRRTGETLTALGRWADATAALDRVVELIGPHRTGPTAPGARVLTAQAQARLAWLRARGGSASNAMAAAAAAERELEKGSLGPAAVDAALHMVLGEAYLDLAARSPASGRADRLRRAGAHLDRAATLWQGAALAAGLEPQRGAALAEIARDRHRLAALVESR